MLENFVKTVVANKAVYYLDDDESFAMCSSQLFYIKENNMAIPFALFWSDIEKAKESQTDDWADARLMSFTLEEFIEICFELQVETMAIGIEFNGDLSGGEEQIPVDIVKALVEEAERTQTRLTFKGSITSLEQVKELIDQTEVEI